MLRTPSPLSIFAMIRISGRPSSSRILRTANILGAGDEACGNEVEVLLGGKADIALVHLADVGHGELHAGDVHALVVGEHAAVEYGADDIGGPVAVVPDLGAAEDYIAVVDKYTGACGDIPGQSLVAYGSALSGALFLASGEGEGVAGLYLGLCAALELSQSYLGTLGVQQGGHGLACLPGNAYYAVVVDLVAFVSPVGKVLTGNVHAVVDERTQDLIVLCGRSQGAYDFGSSHSCTLRSFYIGSAHCAGMGE